jgi:acetyl-CoA carboxylase biotin carboxylase subunit
MLAKLIVFARTRELAIARMERALKELVIDGIETSREFHLRVMSDPEYRRGEVNIQWLEQRLPKLLAMRPPAETVRAAAIAAALIADRDRRGRTAIRDAGTGNGGNAEVRGGSAEGHRGNSDSQSSWAELARREGLR